MNCSCGGKLLYDCDGCGHEWLDCKSCKFHIETYESNDIYKEAQAKLNKQTKPRLYLMPVIG